MTEREKRDKAIAKMAVVGCVRNPQAHTSEECEVCGFKEGMCNAYRHATKLYDAGYRKVDKDGTFHIDISEELTKDFFQNEIKEARKETIKEFVETVKRCLPKEPYLHTWLREIAFCKFCVEVEE